MDQTHLDSCWWWWGTRAEITKEVARETEGFGQHLLRRGMVTETAHTLPAVRVIVIVML